MFGPTLGRILALVIKETLAVWRDKKSRFVLIVPPLIQLAVFSYAATYDVTHVGMVVLNEDTGAQSRELMARFQSSPPFADLRYVETEAAMGRAIDSRAAMLALRLPQDFSRQVAGGGQAMVELLLDGRRSNSAQLAMSYTTTIISGFNRDVAAARGAVTLPGALVMRVWFNPHLDSLWVVVPGLVGVLTQVVALVVTALSVARERELGTFEQLLVTPLRPWEILVGKTLPALLIGLFEGSIILAAAQVWFGIPFTGSITLLYAALSVFLLSIIGVGLFISALSATQQQAILGAFFFVVPAITLSGFATPIENMPDWLQLATEANPIRHILTLMHGLFLKDLPLAEAWRSIWPMLVIAAITLPGAAWLFRRRLS